MIKKAKPYQQLKLRFQSRAQKYFSPEATKAMLEYIANTPQKKKPYFVSAYLYKKVGIVITLDEDLQVELSVSRKNSPARKKDLDMALRLLGFNPRGIPEQQIGETDTGHLYAVFRLRAKT